MFSLFDDDENWSPYKKVSILEKIHYTFLTFIAYLIYDREWAWLELLICTLCDWEMNLHLIKNEQLRHYVDCADTVYVSLGQEKSYAEQYIPKKTMYCENCIYQDRSKIANLFYGEQSSGYCHYIGKGDYSFSKPTDILWDGCKECGRYEDLFDYDDSEEY